MKKGFTLMEIIFVVVIIGGIISLVMGKILDSSTKSQFFSTLQSDAKTIVSKVSEWKSNSPQYKGDFRNLKDASYLEDYLPSNMPVVKIGSSYYIASSGYGQYLRYAVKGDSPNSFETDIFYGDVIKDSVTRQKYAKQIGDMFVKMVSDKSTVKYDLSNAKNGEVKVERIVP